MMTKAKAILAALLATVLVACGSEVVAPVVKPKTGTPISIVAATELKDMEPLIQRASDELGFEIIMDYPDGTIANSYTLKNGHLQGKYDATWFATNKYVELLGAGDKLRSSTSIATSPVAFGVHSKTARELGWDQKQPTWAEITAAVKEKKFRFGMTDPSRSNSGFSALTSVATANADTGAALTSADIEKVQGTLQEFFAGQNLTSGSSGWLGDAFLSDPTRTEAIITYESVLIQLQKSGKADIQVVVPADGVVTADYPLSPLDNAKNASSQPQVNELVKWLQAHNQDIMEETMRRPADPAVPLADELKKNTLIELPFPARQEVADDLVYSYSDDLRNPANTVFVLDKSGSMRGERIQSLHNILGELVDGTARAATGPVGIRNREVVTIIGFDGKVAQPVTTTFNKSDKTSIDQLKSTINTLEPGGQTAIYEALKSAYEQFGTGHPEGQIPSIVLMSDGASNTGMTYRDFERYHGMLPEEARRIPVFVILYGESNKVEMESLAELTGGKTFDATKGDLASAFKEIRGYQ